VKCRNAGCSAEALILSKITSDHGRPVVRNNYLQRTTIKALSPSSSDSLSAFSQSFALHIRASS
jgi:hypothetical protein